MSWSVVAGIAQGADLAPGLRHELAQAVEQEVLHSTSLQQVSLDTAFCHISLAWSEWLPDPVARSVDGNLSLILLGDCYETESLTPGELLQRYLDHGGRALEGLNGRYAVLLLDERERSLQLVSDPLGLRKLFRCELDGQLLLCSRLEAFRHLSGFRPRLDPYGAAQLLISSHLCDDHTLLKGVRLVSPATRLVCDSRGIRHTQYWVPTIEPSDDSAVDVLDAMQAELERAQHCRLKDCERLVLPLSGGLDSRLLAGLLPQTLLGQTEGFSYGHGHSYDRRIGRKVAVELGIPHHSLSLPPAIYQSYQCAALMLADGEVSIEAFPLFRLLDVGSAGSTLLSGFAGDWISSKKRLQVQATPQQSMEHLWQKIYVRKGFSPGRFTQVISDPGIREGYERLQQTMNQSFHGAQADSFADKAQLLEFWHRQRRYVTYQLNVLEARFRVVAPLSDLSLVKCWLNMPSSLKEEQSGYRQLIHRVSPPLAALPVAGSRSYQKLSAGIALQARTDLISGLQQRLAQSRVNEGLRWRLNLGLKGVGRLLVGVSGGWLGPHDRGLLVHHDQDIRHHKAWFQQRLLDPVMAEGIYDPEGVKQLWDEHQRGQQDHSIRINNLIVLSAFRRYWSI
ncbi:asparagine synthase-related protein [Aestuariirhabdus sp. LZHN29]|uniref:asparagine synthase-related protein n=1 Tax=Aestuariirhabdus sp. LZHN29 TaxID=3417462 RepID=UPI003CF0AB86